MVEEEEEQEEEQEEEEEQEVEAAQLTAAICLLLFLSSKLMCRTSYRCLVLPPPSWCLGPDRFCMSTAILFYLCIYELKQHALCLRLPDAAC